MPHVCDGGCIANGAECGTFAAVNNSDLDTREAPTCGCGAPVYAEGLCVRCCEDAFDRDNRALPPELQRD